MWHLRLRARCGGRESAPFPLGRDYQQFTRRRIAVADSFVLGFIILVALIALAALFGPGHTGQ